MYRLDELRLAVIGLGYVGLPLAVEFGKKRSVIGYDISAARIAALKIVMTRRSKSAMRSYVRRGGFITRPISPTLRTAMSIS